MKYLVSPDGSIRPLDFTPESYLGTMVDLVVDPEPAAQARVTKAVASPLTVERDECGKPVAVRQGWELVPVTADDLRITWDASDFVRRVEAVAPGAWDRLDAAIDSPDVPSQVRSQLRMARRLVETSQHVISDDPDTLAFLVGVVAIGPMLPAPILTEDQAAAILTGP